ncbi:MAG TPA: LLM class F420-dependent oxidoreductase [Acidimicrobiia bacterium]|nr:LLM class F420-dependent oxidoreductase [Acidimicrobiia bacterium]
MDLAPVGLWMFQLDVVPWSQGREIAQELEALGYGALWFPEAVGRDALVASTLLLDATQRIVAATGIVPLYARDPVALNAAWQTIEAAFPGRFLLGIGVSHRPAVEGLRGVAYGPPVATMRTYLDRMDAAPFFAAKPPDPPRRVLAALGPKMLALAAERADGAHPYNVTPAHTATARSVLGADKLLAVEQKAVLTADASAAREVARRTLAIYLNLPNYVNNWKRLGFTDDDFAGGGSERLCDAMVVWGDEAAVAARVGEHRDAGADHVCVQLLPVEAARDVIPLDGWRRLAPALLG